MRADELRGLLRVIATGGGNFSPDVMRALGQVIATGGGNLISEDGMGLTAAEKQQARVIATGGGNVISTTAPASCRATC
jgi:shikimate kinase